MMARRQVAPVSAAVLPDGCDVAFSGRRPAVASVADCCRPCRRTLGAEGVERRLAAAAKQASLELLRLS